MTYQAEEKYIRQITYQAQITQKVYLQCILLLMCTLSTQKRCSTENSSEKLLNLGVNECQIENATYTSFSKFEDDSN